MSSDDNTSTVTMTPLPTSRQTSSVVVVRPYVNDVTSDVTLRVVIVVVYCVIFVVGIAGNVMVVYAVARNPSMQSITNVFIANLAASDVMMCLLAAPFTPLSGLLRSWVFGEVMCHVLPMTLGVSVHVSTLTSTAIAVNRYFVIVHPFRPRIKVPVCLALIAAIWTVAVSISLPLAVYQTMSWLPAERVFVCHEQWPPGSARRFYTVTSLVLQYVLPGSVIAYCYARVSAALRTRAESRSRRSGSSGPGGSRASSFTERQRLEIARSQRTTRMLIAMTAIFVTCWLPLNVMILVLEYHPQLDRWRYFLLTFFGAHLLAISSAAYNPFLYAWMNEKFLAEFSRILPWLFAPIAVSRNLFVSKYSLMENRVLVMRRVSGGGGGVVRSRSDRGGLIANHIVVTQNGAQFPVTATADQTNA